MTFDKDKYRTAAINLSLEIGEREALVRVSPLTLYSWVKFINTV